MGVAREHRLRVVAFLLLPFDLNKNSFFRRSASKKNGLNSYKRSIKVCTILQVSLPLSQCPLVLGFELRNFSFEKNFLSKRRSAVVRACWLEEKVNNSNFSSLFVWKKWPFISLLRTIPAIVLKPDTPGKSHQNLDFVRHRKLDFVLHRKPKLELSVATPTCSCSGLKLQPIDLTSIYGARTQSLILCVSELATNLNVCSVALDHVSVILGKPTLNVSLKVNFLKDSG